MVVREVWVSKRKWNALEKRVADLENKQSQPVKVDLIIKEVKEQMKRTGKSAFNC